MSSEPLPLEVLEKIEANRQRALEIRRRRSLGLPVDSLEQQQLAPSTLLERDNRQRHIDIASSAKSSLPSGGNDVVDKENDPTVFERQRSYGQHRIHSMSSSSHRPALQMELFLGQTPTGSEVRKSTPRLIPKSDPAFASPLYPASALRSQPSAAFSSSQSVRASRSENNRNLPTPYTTSSTVPLPTNPRPESNPTPARRTPTMHLNGLPTPLTSGVKRKFGVMEQLHPTMQPPATPTVVPNHVIMPTPLTTPTPAPTVSENREDRLLFLARAFDAVKEDCAEPIPESPMAGQKLDLDFLVVLDFESTCWEKTPDAKPVKEYLVQEISKKLCALNTNDEVIAQDECIS